VYFSVLLCTDYENITENVPSSPLALDNYNYDVKKKYENVEQLTKIWLGEWQACTYRLI
jgi:hypothetical protein